MRLVLTLLAGVAAGGLAVHGLHAQAKPPAYYIAEVEMVDEAAMREFGPKIAAVTQAQGGKYLARGNKITALEGTPPKIVILATFESVERAQAYRNSPEHKALDELRKKSSRERSYIVEGFPN